VGLADECEALGGRRPVEDIGEFFGLGL